ncbi:MAG: polyphosphate kinase 1 [Planctomycetota bacterium]|nr:polyphosphate kinase 1 [Planctomycetota bacterium]
MSENRNEKFFNRELSWLEFNQRVLNEAFDEKNPTLERLKFLAICSSNLDEFFMVRVGGLHLSLAGRDLSRDLSGLDAEQQLVRIHPRVRKMVADQYSLFNDSLLQALECAGIRVSKFGDLDEIQLAQVEKFFEEEVYSSLSPIATEETSFPLVSNQTLILCFRLEVDQEKQRPLIDDELLFNERYVVLPVGKKLPRFIFVPSSKKLELVFVEDIIRNLAGRFFKNQRIIESFVFRVTRNADMRVDDEVASDLLESMEDLLDERTTGEVVRMEVPPDVSQESLSYLKSRLKLVDRDVYRCDGPLALSNLMQLAFASGFEKDKVPALTPQAVPSIDPSESIFASISRSDQVLFHPYQSFEPVVRLIAEAASDDSVLAIKQTLYRTSKYSKIVHALQRAAESGKNVTVILELKARFDEARNIHWARQLENAGANVIYGVRGLKTHAKATLIVRRESSGIVRYCHFGTGNYNEQTAGIYTDVSLLTSDPDLGADAAEFFNAITGFSRPHKFRKLEMAPTGMRKKFLDMIAIETANAKQGVRAFLRAKVNSLADSEIIESLYQASEAGVKVELNVRGICCLRPGMKGYSRNIRVVSLIDRFLEHARIFHFCHGGDERVFISSADWMSRNLDKRIELLVPVESAVGKERLISQLGAYFEPNDKAYELDSEGEFSRVKGNRSGLPNTQLGFYRAAKEERVAFESRTPTSFFPHKRVD